MTAASPLECEWKRCMLILHLCFSLDEDDGEKDDRECGFWDDQIKAVLPTKHMPKTLVLKNK